ncbi:MAG: PAS domain S-box protein [Deltaproteobacteria bacterium]
MGTHTEITERKQAEDALRESRALLIYAFNKSPLMETLSDLSTGRYLEVNDSFCRVSGFSREEVIGKTAIELGWISRDERMRMMQEVQKAGWANGMELALRSKDGQDIVARYWGTVIHSAQGDKLFSTAEDITESKRAEQALARSEARYRGLFDSLMDGFVVVGMDGVIRESNEAYRKMLGYPAEELAQMTYQDLTPERWHPVEARIIEEQVLRRGYSEVYEKEYRRKDGTVFPVELRTFLLKEGDRPAALWAVVRDVTEARALRMRLAVAARMAALGTLVSGVAHEINNPLAAEMADQGIALEVVREVREHLRGDSPVDRGAEGRALDGVVEALKDAQEGGARIAQIVNDLTLFGRPDAKRQRARLMDIVDGAMRWLPATVARSAAIQVENAGAPDVIASPGQIEQILVNLVTNAAKATHEGQRGVVVVRVGPGQPGMARVEVIDHGIGIDPAIRDYIFDPFFTTRPAGPTRGTGLGLAICQSIATAHGGSLTFESEAGKGSTFRLELPAAPDASPSQAHSNGPER